MSQLRGLYLENLKERHTLDFIYLEICMSRHTHTHTSRHLQLPWRLVRSIDWTCNVLIPKEDGRKRWRKHFGLLSTPASSSTKAGRHDIAEILLKVALKNQKSNQINSTCLSLLLLVQHVLLCSWVLYISPLIALLLSTSAQHILLCCSALTQHVLHCCSVLGNQTTT
jgi:hypothetical protein